MIGYLVGLVNDTAILSATARENYLEKTGTVAASVAALGGMQSKTFVQGESVIDQPFAVYLRCPEKRLESDLDANAVLVELANAIHGTKDDDADVLSVNVAPTPYITARDAKDNVFWRLDGVIRYRRSVTEEVS